MEFVSPPGETLADHSDYLMLRLDHGSRIEIGSVPGAASWQEYVASTRNVLLQIVSSYQSLADAPRPQACRAPLDHPLVNHRSSGARPVTLAIRANIRGPIFVAIVECKDDVRPTGALKHTMGSGLRLMLHPGEAAPPGRASPLSSATHSCAAKRCS